MGWTADIHAAVKARLLAQLALIDAAYTEADVEWPGTPPHFRVDNRADWVRLDIAVQGVNPAAVAGGSERIEGTAQVSVFVTSQMGVDIALRASTLADGARAVFPAGLNLTAGGRALRFGTPSVAGHITEDDGTQHVPVECPFYLYTN